ncbi:MAG: ABC transporter ATP-binding protein [Candidatus Hydrogenedentes bacterium]|nr:ABC transporter ATP-binding protein [Candidatus Hydrogenedentota bacterium]
MGAEALKIRGLEKGFPGFHLGPIDITVPTGGMYGLIGPNGAGKTTTIDLIMGMGAKEKGTIEVFGLDHIREEVAVKAKIGYVSPDLSFNAWGRVDRLVAFIRGFYPDWDDNYCDALMKRMKVGWHETISALSYGSRMKLNLVVALAHRPALLLLDEPLAGLDAISKHELFTELLEAIQDETRTVIISSHNLDDIERFADHVGIIADGKMLLEGPTAVLVERFRIVDFVTDNGAAPKPVRGAYIQRRGDRRWRILVDTQEEAIERIRAQGFSDVSTAPVTLEELFVGLVKGQE